MNLFEELRKKYPSLRYIPEVESVIEDEHIIQQKEESDISEKLLKPNEIKVANYSNLKFKAFIDGSYKIAKLANFEGVPVYIGTLSSVLTERTELKTLKEVGPQKHFTVIVFPFKAFEDFVGNKGEKGPSQLFINYLKERYNAIKDEEFIKNVFNYITNGNKDVWIYGDLTYKGTTNWGEPDINLDNILDEAKIRNRANARIRYLMNIIESSYVKYYRDIIEEEEKNYDWILIDGTLNQIAKYALFSKDQSNRYRKYFDKVAGFIKIIRKTPNFDQRKLIRLNENEYLISVAQRCEEDRSVREEEKILNGISEDSLTGKEKWGFIYLRFRVPKDMMFFTNPVTSKGIVKIQFLVTNLNSEGLIMQKGQEIADMIIYEKFPLPCDKRRVWIEAAAIEETEKIAKSRLRSYEWLRNKAWSL